MGEITGFLKYEREDFGKVVPHERVKHWNEFMEMLPDDKLKNQAARCMDCGVPFCHNGCPVANLIPDWNDFIYRGDWFKAFRRLLRTNNFPEFTGRVCPAPCENSCVLAINKPAVTIKNIELAVIERAYEEGWMRPFSPLVRTGKKVAVVGSGPAGLACADQLNKMGHYVTIYEKNEVPGGLLTFGIPNFKLDKKFVLRRINIMREEGIEFKTNTNIGVDVTSEELMDNYDSVVLACGAEQPRDLQVEGRKLNGVHFAMEFLTRQSKINLGLKVNDENLSAEGKKVVVLGGGDTGADCIGTAVRQGAKSVLNLELFPALPKQRAPENPWPQWAKIERVSSSHLEGCQRDFGVMTKKLMGKNGDVNKLQAVRVNLAEEGRLEEIPGSEFIVETDMVILALGFIGTYPGGIVEQFGLEVNERNNIKTDNNMMTNISGVFSAGDMRRGQSLVVWAISEGRRAAEKVNEYLFGNLG